MVALVQPNDGPECSDLFTQLINYTEATLSSGMILNKFNFAIITIRLFCNTFANYINCHILIEIWVFHLCTFYWTFDLIFKKYLIEWKITQKQR